MTLDESKQLFTEIRDLLQANGFTTPEGIDKKYNYRGGYMLFNCPHMCSSVRLFSVGLQGGYHLVRDVRTNFGQPLDWNRELAINFINGVIQQLDETQGDNNTTTN